MEKTGKFLPQRTHNNEAVQVVVRCRPMNEKEIAAGYSCVVECFPSRGAVEITNPIVKDSRESKKSFQYDAVYGWNSCQNDIYEETVRALVASVLDGFNGTIFAYGQTGTGKTYTMEGCKNDLTEKGIIPKSFEQIFSDISRSSNVQYLVRASYLEIYQEEIRDLLNKDQTKKYELRENTDIGVYVKDLSSFVCKSVKEIEQVMYIGNQNRKIGATNMNEHSSRSHAIFMITIEMSGVGGKKVIRVGKLNLVDLAGSERQSKTGATGERLKEASKINLSLSALGNVISALVISSGKAPHIPYRDSKLTRILQDSLGGNSKTIMVANIGPASYNYDESLTTLRYANRAKNIKNKPRVNEDPKDALLREYQMEIARLKNLLALRMQEREAHSEQQRVKPIQQGKRGEEDCDSYGDNKKDKVRLHKVTEEEKLRMCEELESKKLLLAHEKLHNQKLEEKIQAMESKLLSGGKNIIDHTNEQHRALEQRNQEIAERKKLEVEMRQQIEVQEESAVEILETYTTLQQEVEIKTRKLKKLFAKLQAVKQEIHDVTDEFNRDRRELELTQNDLMKDLKVKYLIIENFIPVDEKNKLLARIRYDEEEDTFCISPYEEEAPAISKRPLSADNERRPISDYSRVAIKVGRHHRYHGEENCQSLCNFYRTTFHSSVIACVPKGTRISTKIGTLVTQGQRHRLEMPLPKGLVNPSSQLGVGSQMKPDRSSCLQSYLVGDGAQISRTTSSVREPPVGFVETECSGCVCLAPTPLQTAPHSEFSKYDNIIPLVSCHSSQIQCSDDLLFTDFRFITAVCCIIYLFRVVHILQTVILTVISLHCS